jgi:ankyrin repeat protein
MASTSSDLFAAIDAADVDRVLAILDGDASLATARDPNGVSALMQARYRLDRALTEAVKAHVPELDVFEAASFGDLDRLAVLLGEDASQVTAVSGDGFTALHFAAFFGQDDAVALLLSRGADADAHGTGWMTGTALNSAASRERAEIAVQLLDAGADVNATQAQGFTPLHAAAHNGDAGLTQILLARGADPTLTTDDGRAALSFAEETGNEATIELLRQATA